MGASRVISGAVAVGALAASAGVARRREVSAAEDGVFRRCNRAPDELAAPAWGVMQAGSLGAALAAAAVTATCRGRRDGLVVLAVGSGVWSGVKLVKPLVGRGRPAAHLDGVVVRGQPQNGLGYPSGHAAVAMALALATTDRRRWRPLGLAIATLVGFSRMYTGAHLPLDVVGGWAIGTLAGVTGEAARSDR